MQGGYWTGYRKGYEDAKESLYICTRCSGTMEVMDEAKKLREALVSMRLARNASIEKCTDCGAFRVTIWG